MQLHETKFSPGSVVMTPGVEAIASIGNLMTLLSKHLKGDWGTVCDEDKALNDEALTLGNRLLSAYKVGDETVWIITEADRSVTTFLLPNEY